MVSILSYNVVVRALRYPSSYPVRPSSSDGDSLPDDTSMTLSTDGHPASTPHGSSDRLSGLLYRDLTVQRRHDDCQSSTATTLSCRTPNAIVPFPRNNRQLLACRGSPRTPGTTGEWIQLHCRWAAVSLDEPRLSGTDYASGRTKARDQLRQTASRGIGKCVCWCRFGERYCWL